MLWPEYLWSSSIIIIILLLLLTLFTRTHQHGNDFSKCSLTIQKSTGELKWVWGDTKGRGGHSYTNMYIKTAQYREDLYSSRLFKHALHQKEERGVLSVSVSLICDKHDSLCYEGVSGLSSVGIDSNRILKQLTYSRMTYPFIHYNHQYP